MLMRDFALSIYKCLHSVPEKLKDDDMEVDDRKGADEEDSDKRKEIKRQSEFDSSKTEVRKSVILNKLITAKQK